MFEWMQVESVPKLVMFYLDGFGGQEDELEDVKNGKLDAPTDDEGKGEVFETNKVDPASKDTDSLVDAKRRAGIRRM